MFSSLKQVFGTSPNGDGIRPLAESLADELSVLVFGRSFAPTPQSDRRSWSRDRPPIYSSKGSKFSSRSSKAEPLSSDNTESRDEAKIAITYTTHSEFDVDRIDKSKPCDIREPQSSCRQISESHPLIGDVTHSLDPPVISLLLSSGSNFEAESSESVETNIENSSRRKRKSKGKRRKKIERQEDTSAATEQGDIPGEAPGQLPDHVLILTFQRVMAQGLKLCLISNGKRTEMTFWVEAGVLKWGKQKQAGKERGQVELRDVVSVVDAGPLEIRLGAASGSCIEVGASSLVEKALLLRSFLLSSYDGND
mmetsp:Transcript_12888/g.25427  ORF Transcript_12888/g.25427 Transcript_12888/m.25427 type:complete len:309 (+) Transcript_12888:134-1060(+)